MHLVRPATELKTVYLNFYQEWQDSGEEMIPWVIAIDPTNFDVMIQSLKDASNGLNLRDGWVPDSTFWLIDGGKVIGVVNIRHSLTQHLRNAGGHIGYGIRPSERQKGYATKLLELSLLESKRLGLNEVLVVCDSVNIGSKKAILNNGGIADSDFIEEDGNIVNRFWISI